MHAGGTSLFVVKAMIHAGGRGKGRTKKNQAKGVILCRSVEEVREAAASLLGDVLVTIQTGEQGQTVNTIYVTNGVDIAQEYYLGILLDRGNSKNVIMVSTEGGVEIEKVAEETPEKIIKEWIEPGMGIQPNQARRLAFALGLEGDSFKKATKFIAALYNCYVATDANLVEINPLVRTPEGDIVALDAKMTFDDTPSTATKRFRNFGTNRRRTPSNSKHPNTTSTTSNSMEMLGVWSTVPASQWPLWISSSCRVANLPTSSM